MKTKILTTWDQIEVYKHQWNELLQQSDADSIFLRWEWIEAWKDSSAIEIRPYVVIVESDTDGRLVGIAPFHQKTLLFLKCMPFRTLHIVADYATGSEYPDIIIKKGYEDNVCRHLAEKLSEEKKTWDCIWLPRIAKWSGAFERWKKFLDYSNCYAHERPNIFSSVSLDMENCDFMSTLSKNRQSQLKRQRNKILKRNGVEISKCTEKNELPEYLEALFKLHADRWRQAGLPGAFRKRPEMEKFYRNFVEKAYANDWLWLYALKEKGEIKAVQLGYVYNGIFHQLQEGFDPDYIDGVGNLVRLRIFQDCLDNGLKTYDFLGDHTEHKQRWNAKPRDGIELFIGNRKAKNKILFSKRIWPSGKYMSCPAQGPRC